MSGRAAFFVAWTVLVLLGAVAAVAVGVPLAVVVALGLAAEVVVLRRLRRRSMPVAPDPVPRLPPSDAPPT